ncbi:hypothetical protein BDV59DRAFT_98672 [Aspergillus ambiguus]|uniref:uncharacterized protein n=1 Tax=Aspergillus ambiguus TaxID=176160 RepID=UPI003CCD4E39
MTSTPPPDHKSLSESWATLSASDVHSEDGTRSEQTDVASLIDPTGPEDVASLDERYSGSEIDGNEDERSYGDQYDSKSNIFESQEIPPLFPHIGGSIDDSNLTMKAAFRQSSGSIEFTEPESWPEAERIDSKRTIRVFEGTEASEIKAQIPTVLDNCILTATVQQTMTKKSLDTENPFRVLYVGSSEFRNIILDKIGDVLVASTGSGSESSSTESSRYHVVPTSFGAGAVANFAELLPIHVQLIVDECVQATAFDDFDDPCDIDLYLKNRPICTSFWTGSDYALSSSADWMLPDVAIIFLSSSDTAAAERTQKLAQVFMGRHGIPTMFISERPLWQMNREPVPLNPHSLHMCLESRHPLTAKTSVLRRFPIDVKTFESITPGQLNRNLACLANLYPKKTRQVIAQKPDTDAGTILLDIERYMSKKLRLTYITGDPDSANGAFCRPSWIVFALVCLSFFITSAWRFSQFDPVDVTSNLTTSSSSDTMATGTGSNPTSFSLLPSSSVQAPILSGRPYGNSLEDLMRGAASIADQDEKSGDFEIQVVGDCHLVIKSPSKSPGGKKYAKFSVEVNRRDKPLPYELSHLFDGVYTLKLDRGDAYGVVNVTITTNSKPSLKKTTSVDFGTPWLKIANWKQAAQAISTQLMKEFNTAQTGLSEVYGRLCTDVQVLMGDVVKRAHLLRQEAELFGRSPSQISFGTKEVVLARSKQLSEVVRRNAVQPFLAASSVLRGHTLRVNQEAREMMSGTWNRLSTRAQGFDLSTMMEHVRNARKCKALDKAQKRARGLMRQNTCRHGKCAPGGGVKERRCDTGAE